LKKIISFVALIKTDTNATPNENPTSVPVTILRTRCEVWKNEYCSLIPEIFTSTSSARGRRTMKTLGNENNESEDNFFQNNIPKKKEKYIAEQRAHTASGISTMDMLRSLI